jgi:uncharacterized delta-60 repeat protein
MELLIRHFQWYRPKRFSEVKVQADGKIVLAPLILLMVCCVIIRLNTNGSIDASFVTGAGFNDNVTALAIQPDGKILIGGVFTMYKGIAANRIVRLNLDGSLDASFTLELVF